MGYECMRTLSTDAPCIWRYLGVFGRHLAKLHFGCICGCIWIFRSPGESSQPIGGLDVGVRAFVRSVSHFRFFDIFWGDFFGSLHPALETPPNALLDGWCVW